MTTETTAHLPNTADARYRVNAIRGCREALAILPLSATEARAAIEDRIADHQAALDKIAADEAARISNLRPGSRVTPGRLA